MRDRPASPLSVLGHRAAAAIRAARERGPMDLDRAGPLRIMHAEALAVLSRERFFGHQQASRFRSVYAAAARQISSTFWTAPADRAAAPFTGKARNRCDPE